jgi:hypothetical protein
LQSGYVDGYSQRTNHGSSRVTLANPADQPDLFVKLFSRTWGGKPLPVRFIFLRKGSTFLLGQVSPGTYDIRFQNLDTGEIRETFPFILKEPPQGGRPSEGYIDFQELRMNPSSTTEIQPTDFGF